MMKYVLSFESGIAIEGCITVLVGPFDTLDAAQAWYATHGEERKAAIDVIWIPG